MSSEPDGGGGNATGVAAALDMAWRTHDALNAWTGKVDVKAAFALSIETALMAGVVATSEPDGRLGSLSGAELWIYRAGLLLLVIGVVAAVAAVFPQLRGRRTRTEFRNGTIYFGHLRHWDPTALAERLAQTEPLPTLARELVVLSKVCWRKHRLLQISFGAALLGSTGLLVALYLAS